jgi:hypothetical protein
MYAKVYLDELRMATRRESSGMQKEQEPAVRILTPRQRLAMAIGSGIQPQQVLDMNDSDIHYDFFLSNGITAPLLKAAKILPVQLKARGVRTPSDFRALEFSTLDLVDGAFCASCVAAYGADELLSEFLQTAKDAVVLAGSPAMNQLNLDLGTLLVLCCGEPELAADVIEQTQPRGGCLIGVAPATLLDTGIRAKALRQLGFDAQKVCEQTQANVADLDKLGF